MTRSERQAMREAMRHNDTEEFHRQWRWVRYVIAIGKRGTPMRNRDGTPTPEYIAFTAAERMKR